jgi:hypothetical protein
VERWLEGGIAWAHTGRITVNYTLREGR